LGSEEVFISGMRSNSSINLRQHLKKYYVIVPPVTKTVPLSRYIALCRLLFDSAAAKYKNKDLSSCRAAYVDFFKFQILALERIPFHPDYPSIDTVSQDWIR